MIPTNLAPVSVDITTSMVTVVTILAAVVLGLATLARPTRATITWGFAFGLGVLGAYLWLAGHQTDSAGLRAAASGILLGFEPLIWLGLRMHRNRSVPWITVTAVVVLMPVVLVACAGTPSYLPLFHIAFLVSAGFGGLVAYELLRRQTGARDILLPLVLASCGFVVVAIVSGFSAMLSDVATTDAQLSALRGINAVGTVVVSTGAAFTIVLLVRAQEPAASGAEEEERRARRRLERARAQNDLSWSVLDIRLDDPSDLREASTGPTFALIIERFHDAVQEALPAAADANRIDEARAIVLMRGSEEAVHHHIRDILNRVSIMERDAPVNGVRSSASIGWATVAAVGFDYDTLVAAAAEAVGRASGAGGDRWKRAAVEASAARESTAIEPEQPHHPTTLER